MNVEPHNTMAEKAAQMLTGTSVVSPDEQRKMINRACMEMGRDYEEELRKAHEQYRKEIDSVLNRIASAAGLPNPADACRVILQIIKEEKIWRI